MAHVAWAYFLRLLSFRLHLPPQGIHSQVSTCSLETNSVAESQQGTLYGQGYNQHGCGKLSDKCEKFFVEEGCFYECDKNMGKWRKHTDCKDSVGEDNGWQIEGMPIKASYCNDWYEACKEDKFCEGPTKNFFELPTCNTTTSCKRFGDIYKDGKDVCEVMWGGSFKYETDETKAYVMTFKEGEENPNNKIFTDRKYPETCKGHEVNTSIAVSDGCAADWHFHETSGHPDAGKKPPSPPPPPPTSGAYATAGIATALAVAALLA